MGNVIHRIVERHAATFPDRIAVTDGGGTLTYRELNWRANLLARRLVASRLRRGSAAMVRLPRGNDLAVVLLAVLKTGAAYVWLEPGSPADLNLPAPLCIAGQSLGDDGRFTALDLTAALAESVRSSPNLPVLTRDGDTACIMPDASGRPCVLVPHATIAALPRAEEAGTYAACRIAGALDLWMVLLSGATVCVGDSSPVVAAA